VDGAGIMAGIKRVLTVFLCMLMYGSAGYVGFMETVPCAAGTWQLPVALASASHARKYQQLASACARRRAGSSPVDLLECVSQCHHQARPVTVLLLQLTCWSHKQCINYITARIDCSIPLGKINTTDKPLIRVIIYFI
jgi:hypothetical protein